MIHFLLKGSLFWGHLDDIRYYFFGGVTGKKPLGLATGMDVDGKKK